MLPAFIPSPAQGVWMLGPVPIRAYALCIIIGILVAVRWGSSRWVARGGSREQIWDLAMWAVPAGIIGGRIYHVLSDPELYWGERGRGLLATLRIWDGGLGIWGAIALGFVVSAWYAGRRGWSVSALADALAPGIVVAQAIGRFGNWFNQELFGAPTTLPWGLEIDPAHRPAGYSEFATFHPTFLYEAGWNLLVAVLLVKLERRLRLANGQVFALYVLLYCVGRAGVEMLRIDTANHVLGLRLNVFTAALVGLAAAGWLWRSRAARPEIAT